MAVFTLSGATTDLGHSKKRFFIDPVVLVLFFALFILVSALIADCIGRRKMLIYITLATVLFGFTFSCFLNSGNSVLLTLYLCAGMALMGFTYGP